MLKRYNSKAISTQAHPLAVLSVQSDVLNVLNVSSFLKRVKKEKQINKNKEPEKRLKCPSFTAKLLKILIQIQFFFRFSSYFLSFSRRFVRLNCIVKELVTVLFHIAFEVLMCARVSVCVCVIFIEI